MSADRPVVAFADMQADALDTSAAPVAGAMVAVVVVRDGQVPNGADEAVAEVGGAVLLVGTGTAHAAHQLHGCATVAWCLEWGAFAPAAWAPAIATLLADVPVVLLPASPDGRDLAPRLAHALARPLVAGAVQVAVDRVVAARQGGRQMATLLHPGPLVATLQPGVRGVERDGTQPIVHHLDVAPAAARDARVVEVLPPDAATIDLTEAPRILGGGAGLDGAERFEQLAALGRELAASVGATRVITDRGWVQHERQIGTTGVVVDPRLYLAFGISGAVQHTSGLGDPDHIISVNTDPHCPMMQMADLAVVADANEVLDALVRLLVPAAVAGAEVRGG
jgi:electron transfer flavoprotein alpha subunit